MSKRWEKDGNLKVIHLTFGGHNGPDCKRIVMLSQFSLSTHFLGLSGSFPSYLTFFLRARRFPNCFDLEVLPFISARPTFVSQEEKQAAMKIFPITVLLSFSVIPVLAAPNFPLVGRDVDPNLVVPFWVKLQRYARNACRG